MEYRTQQFVEKVQENKGISFRDLYFYIKAKTKIILITVTVFVIMAIIKTSTTADDFKSSSTLLPEAQNSTNASLGLATLLSGTSARNFMNQNAGISAELYPTLVLSNNFLNSLLNKEIHLKNIDSIMSLSEYLRIYDEEDKLTQFFKLPTRLLAKLGPKVDRSAISQGNLSKADSLLLLDSSYVAIEKKIMKLNPQEIFLIEKLRGRVEIVKGAQLLTITVNMPDPEVAAIVNQMIIDKLTAFLINYQTEKEQKNFQFIEKQLKEAEIKYLQDQRALAAYQNENRNLINNVGLSRQEHLQTEYRLSSSVYTSLAQQLEQARVKVQEALPVLGVIEPPAVPVSKFAPTPVKTVVIFGLVGFFIGIVIVFGQLLWAFFRSWLKSDDINLGGRG